MRLGLVMGKCYVVSSSPITLTSRAVKFEATPGETVEFRATNCDKIGCLDLCKCLKTWWS